MRGMFVYFFHLSLMAALIDSWILHLCFCIQTIAEGIYAENSGFLLIHSWKKEEYFNRLQIIVGFLL